MSDINRREFNKNLLKGMGMHPNRILLLCSDGLLDIELMNVKE